jgi:hypothetical protein
MSSTLRSAASSALLNLFSGVVQAAPNHSPNFFIDEKALVVGVRALAMVTVNYLAGVKTD